MTIGERIVKLRREKNLTQREVAARAGMSITAVSFIETGARSIDTLSLGRAKRLARALGVTVDYLCGAYDESAVAAPAGA